MEIMEPGGKIAAYFPITKTPFFYDRRDFWGLNDFLNVELHTILKFKQLDIMSIWRDFVSIFYKFCSKSTLEVPN